MTYTNEQTKAALLDFVLRMADDRLVLGHRLSEWCGIGPILEEDLALSNIALDLLGQAQLIYTYAAEIDEQGKDEDYYAYFRTDTDFKNAQLLEQPNGDYAVTTLRQLFYDLYSLHLLTGLTQSTDERLRGLAEKSIKEDKYHLRHSYDWTLRLGDGTEESHSRMNTAIDKLWMYTDDLFETTESDAILQEQGIIPDINEIKVKWQADVNRILTEATLELPSEKVFMLKGGRRGFHTEYLGYILTEMQFLPRAYPNANWK